MIRNFLFDLGGVIVDLTRERCVEAFEKLGLKDAESYFGLYAQSGIFMDVEDGTIGADEFHAALRALLPAGTTDAQIDGAFNLFLRGIPVHRLETLRRMRRNGYGIYLLSNTNPIMWDGRLAEFFRADGLEREDYFDGMVTSFEARAAKPDRSIFDILVERTGIKPEETLFFDDSAANTAAAAALGFRTATVAPGTEFIDYLPEECRNAVR